jgi:hypothetical protein
MPAKFPVQLTAAAPAFFTAGKYVIATQADGSLVGSVGMPGFTPSKPDETVRGVPPVWIIST